MPNQLRSGILILGVILCRPITLLVCQRIRSQVRVRGHAPSSELRYRSSCLDSVLISDRGGSGAGG